MNPGTRADENFRNLKWDCEVNECKSPSYNSLFLSGSFLLTSTRIRNYSHA